MGQAVFRLDEDFRRIAEHAEQHGDPIMLAKDDGLYLCTNLFVGDDEKRRLCAYAEGCDPKRGGFDDVWDRVRDIAGGDDFVEEFGTDESRLFARAARDGMARLVVDFSETHMTMHIE